MLTVDQIPSLIVRYRDFSTTDVCCHSHRCFTYVKHLLQVMHGGLFSDDSVTLNDIKKISRDRQPVEGSPMCELLWSDPMESNGRTTSKRGIGCQFGPDVTERFCKANGLDYIIRSHEVKIFTVCCLALGH